MIWTLLNILLALALAPLLPGIINRVKAWFAGRQGKPLLQSYYDLHKLIGKGVIISTTTSLIFTLGPLVCVLAVFCALLLLPMAGQSALICFSGDFFVLAYLLALGRAALIFAAWDTGSAFENMGASREAYFSALSEPVFLLILLALARHSGYFSLGDMLTTSGLAAFMSQGPLALLEAAALFLLLLVENSRIPVDDPNTHLELTMIHEVMILDHSGPDLALLEYASTLKLWLFSVLSAGVLLPMRDGNPLLGLGETLLAVFLIAAAVGVVESMMARLRMMRTPQLISLAGAMAALALIITLR